MSLTQQESSSESKSVQAEEFGLWDIATKNSSPLAHLNRFKLTLLTRYSNNRHMVVSDLIVLTNIATINTIVATNT